ncbi:MAG TPA: MBL fold metallo-hydrolase [Rhizomicrobium sp.]|jgi:hypothetical protein|nr:MBL fold metallo-hydrolase [Rhizomicrobium sp.]
MKITFVNHASVKIEGGGISLLCDPWIAGSAFNNGWDLLVPTPMDVQTLMAGVTHIWVSHEHPDHFVPGFFISIAAEYKDKIEILFQATRDGRVKKFFTGKGFKIRELPHGETVALSPGVNVSVHPNGFYDSWMWLTGEGVGVLNLNDCELAKPGELEKVRAVVGARPDVLLTQFSYAAWKGGRNNVAFRKAAAMQKLETIKSQIRALKPKAVIPFASMVYFSSVENFYLNDSVNKPADAASAIRDAGAEPIVLFPGDSWTVGAPARNDAALARYDTAYAGLAQLPLRDPGKGRTMGELQESFERYRKRVYEKNSAAFIALARRMPLGAFRPVSIRLTDLNQTVRVGLVDGFATAAAAPIDAAMHSSSLGNIFDNEFGYDTLTVNGRFEATGEGFSKLTRSFGVGSLNAMGLSFRPSLLFQTQVLATLLRRLTGVVRRLKQG